MRESEQPMTKTLTVTDTRQHWSQVLTQVYRKEARVIVEKSGIPVAAIVSADDLRHLQELDAKREALRAAISATREAFSEVPDAGLAQEIDAAVVAVRRERRARST